MVLINVAFYLVLTFMPTYLSTTPHLGVAQSTLLLVVVQLAMIAVITLFGRLSDRIGRKPLLITASIGFIVLSVRALLLMQVPSIWSQLGRIAILGILLVMVVSTISSTLPALFPTTVRYSGFAIGYNISNAIFGGTAGVANGVSSRRRATT